MTNVEAIDYLVDIKNYYTEDRDFSYYGDEYYGLTVKEKEALCLAISVLNHSASAQPKKLYTKADYIMALHKEYGCSLTRAEEAHNKALEYLQDKMMMKGGKNETV